ncbi:MAG: hypothetical protein HGA82_02365, partial [Anaerolineales bacterium]|nr:hypothetical protein [Anaerolineales bacterium]
QLVYVVRHADKLAALGRVLDVEDPSAALVFARTRGEVDDLAEALSGRGHDAAALHGGLSQEQRDRVMGRFREGALDVLVATDVAARGLDIEHVSHVVNFDVPSSPDDYVHRIGRTGRAEHLGDAFTLVTPDDKDMIRTLEKILGNPLARQKLEGFDYDLPVPPAYVPTAKSASEGHPRAQAPSQLRRHSERRPGQTRGLRQKFASPGKRSP